MVSTSGEFVASGVALTVREALEGRAPVLGSLASLIGAETVPPATASQFIPHDPRTLGQPVSDPARSVEGVALCCDRSKSFIPPCCVLQGSSRVVGGAHDTTRPQRGERSCLEVALSGALGSVWVEVVGGEFVGSAGWAVGEPAGRPGCKEWWGC